ncbi:hypothetical protein GBF38_007447, partial [Nibea albiflora]
MARLLTRAKRSTQHSALAPKVEPGRTLATVSAEPNSEPAPLKSIPGAEDA